MRQRLIALAAVVAAAAAGTLLFVNWDTGTITRAPDGAFEILDRSSCTQAACPAQACLNANNVLADAGSPCTTRLLTCGPVRVGRQARDWAADSGLTLGPQRYQRLRFIGLRCPAADGGFALGVPMDDDGLPQFMSVAQLTPSCVRAPFDGGTDCLNRGALIDGGTAFYGTGNVFPASQAVGGQCESVECAVFFGDDPDTSL